MESYKVVADIFRENDIKGKEVADHLEVSRQSVSHLLNGSQPFGPRVSSDWADAFGFSAVFLRLGTPPIFEEGREPTGWVIPDKYRDIATQADIDRARGLIIAAQAKADGLEVPLLPAEAHGGTLASVAADPVYLKDCERIKSPVKGVDFALTVTGESMAPEYPNGAIVFVKRVEDSAFIEWGCVYVVDTVNGAIIKQLAPAEDEGYIRCVSLNTSGVFAPFEVNRKHVHAIYRVLGLFIRK